MAKRVVVFFVAATIGLLVQGSVVHTVAPSPAAIAPDLILILVVFTALHIRGAMGVLIAFVLGLCSDFASAQYVGPCAAGMVAAFYSVIVISDKVFAERVIALCALTITASLVKSAMYTLMLYLYVDAKLFTLETLERVGFEALLSAVLAPLVIKLLNATEDAHPVSTLGRRY
jgi:rod shape-determining protein MreD